MVATSRCPTSSAGMRTYALSKVMTLESSCTGGTRWLTTNYKAGDVLCFAMDTVHAALDNHSPTNRCRLSSDSRYQLASEPLDERWNGPDPLAHGRDKVFFPGLGSWNNKDFQDEWKSVDEHGRLVISN